LEGLGIENVVTFYDHLEYFTALWYNLQPLGIASGHLVYFFCFGMFGPRKIWQPCIGGGVGRVGVEHGHLKKRWKLFLKR
jgi:hypothetical protein